MGHREVKVAVGLAVIAALMVAVAPPVWALGSGHDEDPAVVVRLVGPSGEMLFATGLALSTGDRFVAPDNRVFEVTGVEGEAARTRLVGRVEWRSMLHGSNLPLLGATLLPGGGVSPGLVALPDTPLPTVGQNGIAAAPAGRGQGLLALYHTHSDESYLPDSGETNEPWNGDIFRVGRTISELWRRAGLPVSHSYNRHDPHDGLAYARSRRTAMQLVRRKPAAIFDIHRDTPPASVYASTVAGRNVTSVLLVLGRQNPTLRPNEAFAFSIKGYADRAYPRLIRGILYAAGDYNQDLHPRALLAEVGSTYNRLAEAEAGAQFWASVVPAVLFGRRVDPTRMPPVDVPAQTRQASRSAWSNVALLAALAVAGGALFVLINEPAYETVADWGGRLRELVSRWFRRTPLR